MDQGITDIENVIEPVVDVSVFQQLQISKLDGLQRFIAIAVEQEAGGPVGNEQVVGTVADAYPQGLRDLLGTERP